jgi:hypothetical protein
MYRVFGVRSGLVPRHRRMALLATSIYLLKQGIGRIVQLDV